MGFLSGIVKGIGKAVGAVGKVAGNLASTVVKAVPGVGQIYNVATSLVGVDPLQAVGNSIGALTSGGNVGKELLSGLQASVTGGLVSAFLPAAVSPGESLPETSTDPPGVYTYTDGSYAYTVNPDGKVVYNPGDLSNPPASAIQSPNGALSPLPATLACKAEYVKTLLDSYGNPLGVDKANMTMSAVNSYVTGLNPLDGAQQSNLIALEVVNKDPEALAYTAQALAQATGKNAVDWSVILSGVWSIAKNANIPGVSDAVQKVEGEVNNFVAAQAAETFSQKLARFIRDNMTLVVGGGIGTVLLIAFLAGRKR